MALSQTDLEALDSAIASGALTVEFDGRKITYQNTAQLIAARHHVSTVLNGASLNRGPRAFRFNFTTSRGD
ncbi:phage head-tail joining protein [Massilia sp. CMS3.1]|uniref:phage head-tail joining protein n=1 Tax=Massilia sp. CMS3.1 TaxID=3373083 RepID=UPI003EE7270C